MLKIIVVDDEYLVRMGIRQTIDWSELGVEIVGEADNGEDGLQLALHHKPDVIITDVRMPYMNGLEFIAKVKEHQLDAGIIVLSGYDEFQYAQSAMQHGASSYLLKPVDSGQLAKSVQETGQEVLKRRTAEERLGFLNKEIGAISRQFWLDLLLAHTESDCEKLCHKTRLLGISPAEIFPATVMVITSAQVEEPKLSESFAALQELTVNHLKAQSAVIFASLRMSDNQHALVLPLGNDMASSTARYRTFAIDLIGVAIKENRCFSELTIGIGSPALKWDELHMSYVAAASAAEKAAAGLTPVLLANEQAENNYRKEIRAALAYIRDRFAENITVEKVAAAVYVSPTHLMHLFRKELNKTFSECLTEYRIKMAKQMLRDPKYRVYEVGDLVGFGDSKYFSQVFKKMTGMPPSEYAKTR